MRWPVGAVPFVEQLGDGVAVHPGLTFQDPGGFGGGGDTEHRPIPRRQVLHGPLQGGGLAGAGRADHHDQTVGAGDRRGGVGLQHVEPVPVDGGRRLRLVGLGVDRPGQHPFLLGEDRVAGDVRGGRLQPDRTAIRHSAAEVLAGGVEVDAVVDHPVTAPFQGRRPALSRHLGHGRLEVTDRPQDIGPGPRRPGSGEVIDHLLDGHRRRRPLGELSASHLEFGDQPSRAPAELFGFVPPPCRQIRDTVPGLADTGIGRRLPLQGGPLPPARVAALPETELVDLHRQRRVNLPGPLREHLQQLGRHAGDLGLAVDDRLPADPVAMGQLGAQHRLVQATQHPLVAFQVAGIQRPPAPVVGLHLRARSRRGCAAAGRRPATWSDGTSPPTTRACRGVGGGRRPAPGSSPRTAPGVRVPSARRGRALRAARDRRSTPTTPHRLRGRERGVEPGHRPHHLAVRQGAIDEQIAERRPG